MSKARFYIISLLLFLVTSLSISVVARTYELSSNNTCSLNDLTSSDNKNTTKEKDKKKNKKTGYSSFKEFMSTYKEPLANDDIEVIVSADGFTKEQATLSALRNAIEQTYGAFVSSNTQLLNDELIKDEIVSISNGYVKRFECLSESEMLRIQNM